MDDENAPVGGPVGNILLAAAPLLLPRYAVHVMEVATTAQEGIWNPEMVYGGFVLAAASALLLVLVHHRFSAVFAGWRSRRRGLRQEMTLGR